MQVVACFSSHYPRKGAIVLLLTCGLVGGYVYNGGALSGRVLTTPETLNYVRSL